MIEYPLSSEDTANEPSNYCYPSDEPNVHTAPPFNNEEIEQVGDPDAEEGA